MNKFNRLYRFLKKYPFSVQVHSINHIFRVVPSICWSLVCNKRVDIVVIYAQRIGHHIYNHEMYKAYALKQCRKDRKSIILFTNIPANEFLSSFLEKNNPNFTYISEPLASMLFHIASRLQGFTKIQIVPWDIIHPRNYTASIQLPPYLLGSDDKKMLSDAKSRLKCPPSTYISIHNRDSLYLKNQLLNDPNYHDYRDYDINDLSLLVMHLHALNISTIRHGNIQKPVNTDLFPDSLIDLSNIDTKYSSDDILLVSDCLFYVGCSTGFSMVPFLFRKPTLLIQYMPFRLDELCIFPSNSLVVPKLLRDMRTGRLLTFKEIASLDYDIHSTICPFESQGLNIINNTPQEIFDAGLQMLYTVVGSYSPSLDDLELQKAFSASVAHLKGFTACKQVNISIPNSFLAAHSHLL